MTEKRLIDKILVVGSCIIASAILSSCEIQLDVDLDETITILRNQQWQAEITATFDHEVVQAFSPEGRVTPGNEEELILQYLPQLNRADVELSWESQTNEFGDLKYLVHMEGKSLDTLKQSLFSEETHLQQVEIDGKPRIVLSHPVGYPESLLRTYTVTIIAGEVISTNGQLIDDSSVRWVNPSGEMEAVFTGKSKFPVTIVFVVLGICVALATIALLATVAVLLATKQKQAGLRS